MRVQWILVLLVGILLPLTSWAQSLKGTLKMKSWSKSTQSYCAQGSDYYILQNSNGETVLDLSQSDYKLDDLKKWNGKKVVITGALKTRTIKGSDNPMEQRPVSSDGNDFTCKVWEVKKITAPRK